MLPVGLARGLGVLPGSQRLALPGERLGVAQGGLHLKCRGIGLRLVGARREQALGGVDFTAGKNRPVQQGMFAGCAACGLEG